MISLNLFHAKLVYIPKRDLGSLYHGSLKWKMLFNKCEVIILGKTNDTSHLYTFSNTTLKTGQIS